jgi:phosphoribosylanthranilate isomerase
MTKVKLCGLRREVDIDYANELKPDYIGFVFAKKSKRYVEPEDAAALKKRLDPDIKAVGVFVNEDAENIAALANAGTIDAVQLHGGEDDTYIAGLKELTDVLIIKAFKVQGLEDIKKANESSADLVLLDAGAGDGVTFDWSLLGGVKRPYFLAGGLAPNNLKTVVEKIRPYGVDASSSLETEGFKDKAKMTAFVNAARGKEV